MKITKKQLRKLIMEHDEPEEFNHSKGKRMSQEEKIKNLIIQGQFNMAEMMGKSLKPPVDIMSIIINNRQARQAFIKEFNIINEQAIDDMLYKYGDNTANRYWNDMLRYVADDPNLSLGMNVRDMISIINMDNNMFDLAGDAEMEVHMGYQSGISNVSEGIETLISSLFIGRLIFLINSFKSQGKDPYISEMVDIILRKNKK